MRIKKYTVKDISEWIEIKVLKNLFAYNEVKKRDDSKTALLYLPKTMNIDLKFFYVDYHWELFLHLKQYNIEPEKSNRIPKVCY